MNLGIVGTGRMGKAVTRLAEQEGHRIGARCNSTLPPSRCVEALTQCDVVVDFSIPQSVVRNIVIYVENGISAVVGTTGWYDQLEFVESIVELNNGSLLYASNFSTGVALIHKMLHSIDASNLLRFEVNIEETHHENKIDSPSGTAIDLADTLNVTSREIISHRLGDVKGQHQVRLRSLNESITISHEVTERSVFAEGALLAAEWLIGKNGLHTFADVFKGRQVIDVPQSAQIENYI